MKLVHYTDEPVGRLRIIPQVRGDDRDWFKPRGLWVSDDACEDNWKAWCEGENFSPERLALAYDVTLASDANVLLLSSPADIDAFTAEYFAEPYPELKSRFMSRMWIDWSRVRMRYQGMIVTPYIWERRLSLKPGVPDAMWYYSWDCASGCIWDPAAIASITLRPSLPGGPEDVARLVGEAGADNGKLDGGADGSIDRPVKAKPSSERK